MTKYWVGVGIITVISSISGMAQATSASAEMTTDESSFVAVLKRNDQKNSSTDPEVLGALQGLTELSRKKGIKSPDTYKEVARFLEFIHVERWQDIRSNMDSHPAELVLYWGGEESVPVLTDVLLAEPETSPKYARALETVVYIENNDSEQAYALLAEKVSLTVSPSDRAKIMSAALKIKALNQK